MTDPIPARLAALNTMPMPDLKAQWRELFETEPPQYNRRALENRLAYRIQELAYGGLKPETIRRLEILGEQYDSDNVTTRRIRHDAKPVVGTRLVREYRAEQDDITEDEARDALTELDPLWGELFPAEQARIVQLLVERVDVRMHGVEVRLWPNGLGGLVREVAGNRRAAA